jgi:hypothetical protein
METNLKKKAKFLSIPILENLLHENSTPAKAGIVAEHRMNPS